MAINTDYTSNVDINVRNYELQRSLRTEEITSSVDLSDEQSEKFEEINSSEVLAKKDDISETVQAANTEMGRDISANNALSAQENLLNKIKEKTGLISKEGISDTQKEDIQKEIDTMIETYDNIASASYGGQKINDTDLGFLSSSEEAGRTSFETTEEITVGGSAQVSLKDKEGNTINIDSVEIDKSNMEESLKKLTEEINKMSEGSGINASYVYDEENNSGRLVFSQARGGEIDYNMEINDSEDNTTVIETKASAEFTLSDLKSENNSISEEEALALGAAEEEAKNGIESLNDSSFASNVVSSITENGINELGEKRSSVTDDLQKRQLDVQNMFKELNSSATYDYNFLKEVSNGLAGLNELSQAGSLIIAQGNPSQMSIIKLLSA